jgi:energy-coupling factor transporter ATP-binding protein EcfA2
MADVSFSFNKKVNVECNEVGTEEKIISNFVAEVPIYKCFIITEQGKFECKKPDCFDVFSSLVKVTTAINYASKFRRVIKELQKQNTVYMDVREYVELHFPEELKKIEKDPFSWVIEKTSRLIVGNEKEKIAVLLSLVSSQFERQNGIYRIHLLFIGSPGAGKSSTVKSVLKLLPQTDMVIMLSRMTKNALAYFPVDNLDNRVLFLEELDDLDMLTQLKKLLSEGRLETAYAMSNKEQGEIETKLKVIEGMPAFITTTVIPLRYDYEMEQTLSRIFILYRGKIEPKVLDKIAELIGKKEIEIYSKAEKLSFYAWLISRPKLVQVKDEVKERIVSELKKISESATTAITRMESIYFLLVQAVASARGKTVADESDLEFVNKWFKRDILLNAFAIDERDLKILNMLVGKERRIKEIANELHSSVALTKKVLSRLIEDKSLVDYYQDDKGNVIYTLSEMGSSLIATLTENDEEYQVVKIDELQQIYEMLKNKEFTKDEFMNMFASDIERVQFENWAKERGVFVEKNGKIYILDKGERS